MIQGIPDEVLKAIKNICGTFSQVKCVWLFGSRARGDFKARSDIDLAVEAPMLEDEDWVIFCERLDSIETLLAFDIVRFDSVSVELSQKILREGILLYEQK